MKPQEIEYRRRITVIIQTLKEWSTFEDLVQATGTNIGNVKHYMKVMRNHHKLKVQWKTVYKRTVAFKMDYPNINCFEDLPKMCAKKNITINPLRVVSIDNLPKKMTDLFLITWAHEQPELNRKSSRQIMDFVKSKGHEIVRYREDGSYYNL